MFEQRCGGNILRSVRIGDSALRDQVDVGVVAGDRAQERLIALIGDVVVRVMEEVRDLAFAADRRGERIRRARGGSGGRWRR
jgi:hypothetical protein